jgi:hypothetical protein
LVTAYAADLTGSGHAELFELNGYRSTYNLIPSIVAPAFQLAIVGDPVAGPQGSGIVLLDVVSASSTTINLSASDPAITLPATITVPAGSVAQTFNFSIGAAFNENHVFSITAQSGSTSAVAYGTAVASGTARFQAGAGGPTTWPNVNLGAGQTVGNIVVGVSSVNGYSTTTMNVQCLGLSAVAQCQINSPISTVRPGDSASSNILITVNANTPQGSYPGSVQVTDGLTTQNFPFTVNVGDFSMSLPPQPLQILPTDLENYTLTVGSINQFDQIVNLTCGGLPAGATCSILDTPINVGDPPGVVTVQTQSVPVGNYQLTVTGSSPPITHTLTAQLQVSDFTASVSPADATVSAGGSANFNISITPVNGFSGSVNFACSSSSGLISCSFSPASTIVPANGTAASVLTLTASSQAGTGGNASSGINAIRLSMISLALPLGAFLFFARTRRKSAALLLLILCGTLSCGGGSNSGGGGGGGGGGTQSQSYSITVQVNAGSSDTKSAGTITLTVN